MKKSSGTKRAFAKCLRARDHNVEKLTRRVANPSSLSIDFSQTMTGREKYKIRRPLENDSRAAPRLASIVINPDQIPLWPKRTDKLGGPAMKNRLVSRFAIHAGQ